MPRTKKGPRSETKRITELVKKVNATLSSRRRARNHTKHADLTVEEMFTLLLLVSPNVSATTILVPGGRVRTRVELAEELHRKTRGRSVLDRAWHMFYTLIMIINFGPLYHSADCPRNVRHLRATDLVKTCRKLADKEAEIARLSRPERNTRATRTFAITGKWARMCTESQTVDALRKLILDRRGLAICLVHPLTGQLRGTCDEICAACQVYSKGGWITKLYSRIQRTRGARQSKAGHSNRLLRRRHLLSVR